ncbi:MAG: hypothetical protein KDA90_15280 [Planctomycetaceae bacterium]|nr:hypothetical protein [Planctomycetaceae bacterium]
MRQLLLLLALFSSLAMFSSGCGGSVQPGVADGPEQPAPELTPEQVDAEREAARNAAGGN